VTSGDDSHFNKHGDGEKSALYEIITDPNDEDQGGLDSLHFNLQSSPHISVVQKGSFLEQI
jgi:hypothetical protein